MAVSSQRLLVFYIFLSLAMTITAAAYSDPVGEDFNVYARYLSMTDTLADDAKDDQGDTAPTTLTDYAILGLNMVKLVSNLIWLFFLGLLPIPYRMGTDATAVERLINITFTLIRLGIVAILALELLFLIKNKKTS